MVDIQKTKIRVEKPWGWELIFTPKDTSYTGKLLFFKAGARNSLQYHTKKTENLMLFSGQARILLGEDWVEMEEEVGYTVYPGQKHRIEAADDSYIFEASTQEVGETIRLEDDWGRGTETEEDRDAARNS